MNLISYYVSVFLHVFCIKQCLAICPQLLMCLSSDLHVLPRAVQLNFGAGLNPAQRNFAFSVLICLPALRDPDQAHQALDMIDWGTCIC